MTKERKCNMMVKRDGTVADYITQAFLLLLQKKSFHDIRINELCEKAGVTRMSFYRNFESKEAVHRKWLRVITDEWLDKSGISFKYNDSRKYFVLLFRHMGEYRDFCARMYKDGMLHLVKDEFDRVFLTNYKNDYDEYKSYFLSGGIFNIFQRWLMSGCVELPEELADKLERILEK